MRLVPLAALMAERALFPLAEAAAARGRLVGADFGKLVFEL